MKTFVVSLIFLPVAAAVLLVPLIRLAVPVWPVEVEERLDADGRPVLSFAHPGPSEGSIRARPRSAAVLDRNGAPAELGYVVGLRAPDGRTRPPPDAALWWPGIEVRDCELGLSIERVLIWQPCASFPRVHHPNRMTTASRLRVAIDRLLAPADRHRIDTTGD